MMIDRIDTHVKKKCHVINMLRYLIKYRLHGAGQKKIIDSLLVSPVAFFADRLHVRQT